MTKLKKKERREPASDGILGETSFHKNMLKFEYRSKGWYSYYNMTKLQSPVEAAEESAKPQSIVEAEEESAKPQSIAEAAEESAQLPYSIQK